MRIGILTQSLAIINQSNNKSELNISYLGANMETWENLRESCLNCDRCALHETRTNVVFGDGNPESEVLFIGEGPGEQEDLTGRAFVGRAGKLLDDMLTIIDLDRSKIFIANIVKCRPPKNRDPLNTEQDACITWLRKQTALMRPKIIVCLGRISAMRIIKPDFKITAEHGKWFESGGIKMMALYHPAALLRDPGKRPDTFLDLKELRTMIDQLCTKTY
jgi:uracil-DNA glycosylase, family 4